ncbi:unnamed protein product [Adineta steineri]|uniref:Uncharacterized protein n=1 Tax=Adineta steineri TaxID=433720 RepID=A0A819BBW5_9BILA|nr:unnamed protein product [Adineta steineri]CAF0774460.1 unnamed protein product [Adineta steineri]CAF3614999.1 unnamed protein product [Adineta steineri]CAF3798943.1 unnamed protein product [Adineta steineri]
MFSIWLSLLIVLSVNIINVINLRCNEDIDGSLQVIENCRACVIFITPTISPSMSTTKTTTAAAATIITTTAILPRNIFISNVEPSIEELFLFDEKKRRRRRRRRHNANTEIHQQCAREIDGPLYGYDQTHCYCNSNQCNSNIQRCIYEVTSKRLFACYHGSNSTQYPLGIFDKCRSCRIRTEFNSIYHYECLTFGEHEQNNQTHCTCQRPMCNQDIAACQRFQPAQSHLRTNLGFTLISNSTTLTSTLSTKLTSTSTIKITTTTTTTTSTTTTTATSTTTSTATSTTSPIVTTINETTMTDTETSFTSTTRIEATLSTRIETEEEISTENSTIIELTTLNENTTSFIEIKHLKTVYIEVKNHANYLSSNHYFNFYYVLNIFISFYLFDVITSFIS